MASVFLSYDRNDANQARGIAKALERAGNSVWWDRHIQGGTQFSRAIEQALHDADAVVVLWSTESVQSTWVRDEAAEGRDSGKLIPVTLDGALPPMGFRQFQVIGIPATGHARNVALQSLADAVASIAGKEANVDRSSHSPNPPRAAATPHRPWRLSPVWAALVAAVITLTGVGYFLFRPASASTSVTVAAADGSAASQALARDLLFKLSTLQSSRRQAIRIISDRKSAGDDPDLVFQVASEPGAKTAASLALVSRRDGQILWSGEIVPPSGTNADLNQQIAFSAGGVLDCAGRALTPATPLKPDTLTLYLGACARIAGLLGGDVSEVIPLFEEVTRQAPKFADGWAKLLLAMSPPPIEQRTTMTSKTRAQVSAVVEQARALDPDMPEAAFAEIISLPDDAIVQKFALIERALKASPDDPNLLILRSSLLGEVGRWNAAIVDARNASRLDPLNPWYQNSYLQTLGSAGQTEAAFEELAHAERNWPGASNTLESRLWLNIRFGDPQEAIRLLRSGVSNLPTEVQLILLAKISPTPENLGKARTIIRGALKSGGNLAGPIQGAALVGITSELWPVLLHAKDHSSKEYSVLFRPAFREFRHDPRFLQVVKRTGVLAYWQQSGKWPDFCGDPDLPYDCKAEAAKKIAA